jgi:hypothetical protein
MKEKNRGYGQRGGEGWSNIWRVPTPPIRPNTFFGEFVEIVYQPELA